MPVYNEAEAVRLTGKLNVDALERAMNVVVDRHEVLRSTVKVIGEVPHAVIHERWPLRFKKIDLSALPAAEREAEVDRLLIDEPRLPYHLETEPGIRVALLHLSPREHVFILMMHHIVCDWASEGIIWRDLSAAYRAHPKRRAGGAACAAHHARRLCGVAAPEACQRRTSPRIWPFGKRRCAALRRFLSCPPTGPVRR